MLKQYKTLGIGGAAAYDPDWTPAQRMLMHSIICEELGWGDVGLALICLISNIAPYIAYAYGRMDLAEFFGQRDEIVCTAMTEPDHGSDLVGYAEPTFRNPNVRPSLRVRRDGDDFILNGQKSSWISAGPIAGCGKVFATYEGSKQGFAEGAVFLMPLDLPGITRGKPLDKLGQRSLCQGELFFDNVRVPGRFFLADGPEGVAQGVVGTLQEGNIGLGLLMLGVARAAYEHALAYAKERVQGGVPIIQHQAVKLRLFKMFQKLTLARSHLRRIAAANASKKGGLPFPYAASAKIVGSETAYELAHEAMSLFGGYAMAREYPLEKLFRDARASLSEDGENTVLALNSASFF